MTWKKISTLVLLFFPVFIFGKSFSLRTEVSYSNLSIEDSTPNRRLFNGVQVGLSGLYTPQSNKSESLAPVIGLGVNYEFLVANSIFSDDEINSASPILKNKACINAIYGSFLAGFSLRANMRLAFEILGSFDYAFFARANYTNSSALSSFDTLTTADPKLDNVLTSTTLDKAYNYGIQFGSQYLLTKSLSLGAALSWKIVHMDFASFNYDAKKSDVKKNTGRTILAKIFLGYTL